MKRFHVKTFFAALAVLLPLGAQAEVHQIGDFYYDITSSNMTASLTEPTSGTYSGDVVIPSTVEYAGETYSVVIGSSAFRNSTVTSVIISEGVTQILDFAFSGCLQLTSISIPESVTFIDGRAFAGSTALTTISIPQGITEIKGGMFFDCTSLAAVTLPAGLTTIKTEAFSGCWALASVNIPEGVTSIEARAFMGCHSLTSVTLPASLASISFSAFYGCGLVSVVSKRTEPVDISTLSNHPFKSQSAETVLTVPYGTRQAYIDAGWTETYFTGGVVEAPYAEVDGLFYKLDGETLTATLTGDPDNRYAGNVVVPETVTYLGQTYTVTAFEQAAFDEDELVTSIVLPPTVTGLPTRAFQNCQNLTQVNIPEGVTLIPAQAFGRCNALASITLPASLESIAPQAFVMCKSLAEIVMLNPEPPSFVASVSSTFMNVPATCTVYVPQGAKAAYEAAIGSKFTNIIEMTDCVEIDGIYYKLNAPFAPNATVVAPPSGHYQGNYVIPSTITYEGQTYTVHTIGEGAFKGCVNLFSVTLGDEDGTSFLTSIHPEAFMGCTQLQTVTLPASIIEVHENAFVGCTSLQKVILRSEDTFCVQWSFQGIASNGRLYVPTGKHNEIAAYAWTADFNSIVEMGDTNADGSVSITDVGLMIDYILGHSPSGFDDTAADTNFDGSVTITDVGIVIDAILSAPSAGVKQHRPMPDTMEHQPE